MLSLPETAFAPLHPPVAVQAVALVLVQVSVLVPPAATDSGLAVSVTTGAGAVPPLFGGDASLPPPQATRVAVNTRSAILISLMAAMIGNRGTRRESSA